MSISKIICPHCENELSDDGCYDLDVWQNAKDDEPFEYCCGNCNKKVFVNAYWTPNFKTFKTEEERDES